MDASWSRIDPRSQRRDPGVSGRKRGKVGAPIFMAGSTVWHPAAGVTFSELNKTPVGRGRKIASAPQLPGRLGPPKATGA